MSLNKCIWDAKYEPYREWRWGGDCEWRSSPKLLILYRIDTDYCIGIGHKEDDKFFLEDDYEPEEVIAWAYASDIAKEMVDVLTNRAKLKELEAKARAKVERKEEQNENR